MKTYTIEVTPLDIKRGNRKSADNCPVARATRRATKRQVVCGLLEISIGYNFIKLPKKVTDFIYDFDGDRPVKPFSFKLKVRRG